MRPLLCLLLLAAPALAADPPPPTLSPTEVALGWVLLFDGESTFGWKVDGEAKVDAGRLVVGGDKATTLTTTAAFPGGRLRYVYDVVGTAPAAGGRIVGQGGHVVARFDGHLGAATSGLTVPAKAPPAAPLVGPLTITVPAGHKVAFRTLAFHPGGFTPLFNGKDLSGWKKFDADPKKAVSTFAVTPAGELGIKDGPGDLQTTTQYADFVLQFECKTNGKGLNSGVFFRCLPGEYQNGYEAQVQNLYLGTDRAAPADFGTGAIYRRVKARKVVSNDNEWFTMTVAATGNHISTWVNGYPTVDWTDDRPADVNARKGSKTGKGHLSLQGHDPTTDILFRNIRIADLPAK